MCAAPYMIDMILGPMWKSEAIHFSFTMKTPLPDVWVPVFVSLVICQVVKVSGCLDIWHTQEWLRLVRSA